MFLLKFLTIILFNSNYYNSNSKLSKRKLLLANMYVKEN